MIMSPSHGTFREVSQGFLNVHIQNYCNCKCMHVILGIPVIPYFADHILTESHTTNKPYMIGNSKFCGMIPGDLAWMGCPSFQSVKVSLPE